MDKKESFNNRVWKTAKKKTVGSIQTGLYAVIFAVVVTIARFYVFGRNSAMTYIQEFLVDFILAGGLFTIVYFFVYLVFVAPYKVGKEQDTQIKALEPVDAKIEIIIPSSPNPFDGENIPLVYENGNIARLIIWNKNKTADLEKCFARFEYIGDITFRNSQPRIDKFPEEHIQENILWDGKSLSDGAITIAADGKEVLDILKINDDGFEFLFQSNNNWKETILDKRRKYDYLISLRIFGHLNGHPIADVKELYVIHLEYFWVTNVPQGKEISNQGLLNQKLEPRLQINKVAIKENTEN